jgi:hypothetical protein
MGATLAACWLLAELWFFYGFTRFYFPGASVVPLGIKVAVLGIVSGYFLAVVITRRWAPWKSPQ